MADLNIRIGGFNQEIDNAIQDLLTAGLERKRSKDNVVNSKGNTLMERPICKSLLCHIYRYVTKRPRVQSGCQKNVRPSTHYFTDECQFERRRKWLYAAEIVM
ncbi:hypothetical protein ACFFRR_009594 [Megaselia abdita]